MARKTSIVFVGSAMCVLGLLYFSNEPFRQEAQDMVRLLARADITPIRDYLLSFGVWAPLVSVLLQVVTSVIAPLPGLIVTFSNAMIFGFWWGSFLTWSSWLLAASICFGMARALGRPVVERLATRKALELTDRYVENAGFRTLLVARLIPFVNPDVLSYAAGLTSIGFRTFLVSMAVGAIPSTLAYSYLGARGVTQVGWLVIPLTVVGLLAMLIGALVQRRSKGKEQS